MFRAEQAHAGQNFGNTYIADIGSQLLRGFDRGVQNFHQAVVDYQQWTGVGETPASEDQDVTDAKGLELLHDNPDRQVTLTVHTRSGAKVEVVVAATQHGWSRESVDGVEVNVKTDGVLGSAEKAAIAKLADGFGQAINGLNINQPDIEASGLTRFDSQVLSSVDLSFKNQVDLGSTRNHTSLSSLSFHADSGQRALKVTSYAGTVDMKIDLTTSKAAAPGLSGTARQAALKAYLDQADAAAKRAHESPLLVGEFRQAFSQLQAAADTSTDAVLRSPRQPPATRALTGLADFKASMSGESLAETASGARRLAGHFEYQLDQQTATTGRAGSETVTQTQHSALSAHHISSLDGGIIDVRRDHDATTLRDEATSTMVLASTRAWSSTLP